LAFFPVLKRNKFVIGTSTQLAAFAAQVRSSQKRNNFNFAGFAETVHENKSFIQYNFRFRMTDDGLETLKFLQQAFTFTHRKWSALPLPPLPDREDLQAIPFSSSTDLPPLFDVNLLDNEVADPLPEPSIFICPFCTSTFMNLQALGVHEGKIHGTLLDKHCYVCGQEEQTEYHLSTHIALCELMFTEHKPQT